MSRNTLKLTTNFCNDYIYKLDSLNADLKKIVEDALNQAGETIEQDTREAVQRQNLPAKGKYSMGDTEASIVNDPKTEWKGMTASIGVGFDYGKGGAGGLLITGTPHMPPDRVLNQMYKGRRYINQIKKDMINIFQDEIERKME